MYSSPTRFSRVRYLVTAVAVLGVIGGGVVIVIAAVRTDLGSGIGLIAAGGAIIGVSLVVASLTRLALKIESNTFRLYSEARELHEHLTQAVETLNTIAENTSISEAAKSIAHRDQERHALREAIYEEIRREDYEGAFHLIDDLETRLGYREEAERLREENRSACNAAFRSKLAEAIEHVNHLFEVRQWGQARREIERLEKVMPAEPRVKELWNVLSQRREECKQSLLRDWKTAAAESDVGRAIEILKEIDEYLTRDEARAMESGAREMFKERLQQLGLQFQFAVNEKRWRDALATGLEIMEEFPNTRMAREVRDHLGALRSRAGIPTNVEVTARGEQPGGPGDSVTTGTSTTTSGSTPTGSSTTSSDSTATSRGSAATSEPAAN